MSNHAIVCLSTCQGVEPPPNSALSRPAACPPYGIREIPNKLIIEADPDFGISLSVPPPAKICDPFPENCKRAYPRVRP
jgi:hypothetical protein